MHDFQRKGWVRAGSVVLSAFLIVTAVSWPVLVDSSWYPSSTLGRYAFAAVVSFFIVSIVQGVVFLFLRQVSGKGRREGGDPR
ncbi:hypothetical protein KEM60_00001 [Austwickia sp. TVS 96-490-7B]|nr:hypothetical protein [Austwickia sp. TVS 96-490-7B]